MLESRPDPRRDPEGPVSDEHPDGVTVVDQLAGVAASAPQRGVDLDLAGQRLAVEQGAGEARGPAGEEPLGLRGREPSGVEAAMLIASRISSCDRPLIRPTATAEPFTPNVP